MKLHHVKNGKADWCQTEPESWNFWQRLAARTRGWITPGNAATGAGDVLFGCGMYEVATHNPLLGLVLVGVARSTDVLDGYFADRTGTKSPLGEMADAGSDKLQMAAGLGIFMGEGILPPIPGALIATEQAAIAGLTVWAKKRGRELHPSKWGKLSMAGAWGSFCGWIGERVIETVPAVQTAATEAAARWVDVGSWAGAGVALGFGGLAIYGYTQDILGPGQEVISAREVEMPMPPESTV